jgi:hypothetical protein
MVEFSLTFTIIQSNIYDSNIYELRLIYICTTLHVLLCCYIVHDAIFTSLDGFNFLNQIRC